MNSIYRWFNAIDWVNRIHLIIAVIINYIILLVVLFVICVEWLIDYCEGLLQFIFFVVILVFILNNIYRAFDINHFIVVRLLSWHLTLWSFAFIQENERPIEIVGLVLSWFILLSDDRDVVIVVANTERKVVCWLMLDHGLGKGFVTCALILEDSRYTERPWVMKLLQLVWGLRVVAIRVHTYIIDILIRPFYLLREGWRGRCLFGYYILRWAGPIWWLKLTYCSYFLLFRLSKGIKSFFFIGSFTADGNLVFLDDMRVIVQHVHVCRAIKKIRINLNVKSLIARFLSDSFRLSDWGFFALLFNSISIIFGLLFAFDGALITLIWFLWLHVTTIRLDSTDFWISTSRLVVSVWLCMFAWCCRFYRS